MVRGTRTGRSAPRLHAVLVTCLAVLVGCTTMGEPEANRGAGVDAVASGERHEEPRGEPVGGGTTDPDLDDVGGAERSPLQRFLGGDAAPAPVDEQTRARLNDELERDLRERERLIAECMADLGFTYHPMDPINWSTDRAGGDAWLLPEEEFAARYGFGITTIDRDADAELEPHSPNQEMLASLSEAEQNEWLAALHGDGSWGGFDSPEDGSPLPPIDGVGVGCFGEAHEAIARVDPHAERLEAEYQGLFEEFGALERRIAADPRAEVAARQWSDCMADAGYPGLTRPGDAEQLVEERLDQLTDGGTVADLRASDLADLQAMEVELAVADHACLDGFVVATAEIRRDHEERFIEEHRAELERFRDAISLAEQP